MSLSTYSVQSPAHRFRARVQPIAPEGPLRLTLIETAHSDAPLTWQAVIHLWQHEADFRALTAAALVSVPYAAFFWETPPITSATLQQPWECIVATAPALTQVEVDLAPFAQYLDTDCAEADISVFPNLGGDATLIVPCPQPAEADYSHLAAFLRQAPADQVDRLWQTLGHTLQAKVSQPEQPPLWVNTSGLGVHWLHVRLDTTPKYYTYAPYRHLPE